MSMTKQQLIDLAIEKFNELQNRIYGEVNALLKYAKLNTISVLQDKTPSYSESAAILKQYVSIIEALQEKGIPIPKQELSNLERIVTIFTALAVAIDESDIDGLGAATAALDCEPYLL